MAGSKQSGLLMMAANVCCEVDDPSERWSFYASISRDLTSISANQSPASTPNLSLRNEDDQDLKSGDKSDSRYNVAFRQCIRLLCLMTDLEFLDSSIYHA